MQMYLDMIIDLCDLGTCAEVDVCVCVGGGWVQLCVPACIYMCGHAEGVCHVACVLNTTHLWSIRRGEKHGEQLPNTAQENSRV